MQEVEVARPAGGRRRSRSRSAPPRDLDRGARSPSRRPGSPCPRPGCTTCRSWRTPSPRPSPSSARTATSTTGFQDRYMTKADGTFRLVGLPGRAIVGRGRHKKPYSQRRRVRVDQRAEQGRPLRDLPEPDQPGRLWPTVMKEINPAARRRDVWRSTSRSTRACGPDQGRRRRGQARDRAHSASLERRRPARDDRRTPRAR